MMPQQPVLRQTTHPSLVGKTIMVTGSSSGIGRAIAIELAKQGASLLIHGRQSSDNLDAVKAEIEALGQSAMAFHADFSQTQSLIELVDAAWNANNGIDGWINNAGGDVLTGEWPSRSLATKLQYLWQVDVLGTLLLSRSVGEKMVQRFENEKLTEGGCFSIINMGWDQAQHGMAGESGELFATTKGAIMAMSGSLAQSLAPAVRVNCLAPGWIQTQWGDQASTYWTERAKNESLMNRWGTPTDVANAAAFLCSDASIFIAGQVIPVNGGFKFSRS